MGGFRAGSAGLVVAALTGFGVAGLAAPSYADTTVTVQGTAFPDPARAAISFVGCPDLYQRTDEQLVPTVGQGPGVAPSGTRSLGWDLAGGNAVGALFPVDSMLSTTTASISVNAVTRATGVAYAGYQDPGDAGTSVIWLGRSDLVTPGGAWQTVDATTRLYSWAKYDMTTRQQLAPGPGVPTTVAGFAAAHGGDGPGLYTIGFGCDGTPFSMDQLRVGPPGGVTTYDVEGLQTSVAIAQEPADAGDHTVTITGRLHTGTGDPVPNATMILERRLPGTSVWKQVLVADVENGTVKASVERGGPAFYRWRFVERPLAEGSASMALLVDVLPPLPTVPPTPTQSTTPTELPTPTEIPSDSPTSPPTDPSATPSSPSSSPSSSASSSPSSSPSSSQSSSPADPPPSSAPVEPTQSPNATESSAPAGDSASPTGGADESAAPSGSDSHGTS